MLTLAVILARAGSKGLPDKCVLPLCGRPVLAYTIDHARSSRWVSDIVLTTDSEPALRVAREAGIRTIRRPPALAADTARVDDAVRHAVLTFEFGRYADSSTPATRPKIADCPLFLESSQTRDSHLFRVDAVVILYGNIPVRAEGVIDGCLEVLEHTGCDSVRTVAPVTKQHPDWIHRLDGDRLVQFRPNSIHRRQDLEPLYYHDGAVIAVTRASLFAPETAGDPHAFFGCDRRAVVQSGEDAVDIDTRVDLYLAEAILRWREESRPAEPLRRASSRPGDLLVTTTAGDGYERYAG